MPNHLFPRVLGALAAVLCFVQPSFADVSILEKYVNDRTILITRIDLTKMNVPAAAEWLAASMQRANAPADIIAEFKQKSADGAKETQRQIDQLTASGVKEAYFVFSVTEQMQPLPLLVMPKPANPEPLKKALEDMQFALIEEGDVYVATDRRNAQQKPTITPAARLDLVLPLKDAKGAATMALSLSDGMRQTVEAIAPQLPPAAGGAPMTVLTDGIRLLTVNFDAPPQAAINATAKAKDPAAAQALKDFLDKLSPKAPQEAQEIIGLLSPTLQADTLVVDLKQAQLDKLVAVSVPAMIKARESANRIKSASNLRQLMMGAMLHTNENQGTVPASLDEIVKGQDIGKEVLVNPLTPDLGEKSYVYVVPSEAKVNKIQNPSVRMAIYEAGEFGEGKNVAFWDGHVEFIKEEQRFNDLKKAAGVN